MTSFSFNKSSMSSLFCTRAIKLELTCVDRIMFRFLRNAEGYLRDDGIDDTADNLVKQHRRFGSLFSSFQETSVAASYGQRRDLQQHFRTGLHTTSHVTSFGNGSLI